MAKYNVRKNGTEISWHTRKDKALSGAEELMKVVADNEPTTITVDEDGYLLAAITNRRIMGTFYKQQWGGRNGNDAVDMGEESFDATNAVLLLNWSQLIELEDNSDKSDEIGLSCINWNGPCHVNVVDAICQYFGVKELDDITTDALEFARSREKPQEAEEVFVTLSVQLKLKVVPGASISDCINNLDYSFVSNTNGIVVKDTEILDYEDNENSENE